MNNFGTLLKKYREKNSLSQRELGERCNLSRIYIATLENGARGVPPESTILKIANALLLADVEIDKLLEIAQNQKMAGYFQVFKSIDFLANALVQNFSKDEIVALTEKLESKLVTADKETSRHSI
ncbi:MAG: hypothetical protein LiPW30_725 [Parcubacteria group bacterium LiPW_30]|nr:MAG: hypothetical protein LiPW30_725 [Parcubacteria group bacterium LiPW_30]